MTLENLTLKYRAYYEIIEIYPIVLLQMHSQVPFGTLESQTLKYSFPYNDRAISNGVSPSSFSL